MSLTVTLTVLHFVTTDWGWKNNHLLTTKLWNVEYVTGEFADVVKCTPTRETRTGKRMRAECSWPIFFYQQYAVQYHSMCLISIINSISNTMHQIQCLHVPLSVYVYMYVLGCRVWHWQAQFMGVIRCVLLLKNCKCNFIFYLNYHYQGGSRTSGGTGTGRQFHSAMDQGKKEYWR